MVWRGSGTCSIEMFLKFCSFVLTRRCQWLSLWTETEPLHVFRSIQNSPWPGETKTSFCDAVSVLMKICCLNDDIKSPQCLRKYLWSVPGWSRHRRPRTGLGHAGYKTPRLFSDHSVACVNVLEENVSLNVNLKNKPMMRCLIFCLTKSAMLLNVLENKRDRRLWCDPCTE